MNVSHKRARRLAAHRLETLMRVLSRLGAVIGFGLMIAGFGLTLVSDPTFAIPGPSAMPLAAMLRPQPGSLGLVAMSAGIVCLVLLPVSRVVLALGLYIDQRDKLGAGVSLAVLLELVISTQLGGR